MKSSIELEGLMTEGLGRMSIVDGHYCCAGEMNIIIHNLEPAFAWEQRDPC
jgi:hypothetical protein